MRVHHWVVVAVLAAAGCGSKKSSCEEAKERHVAFARKMSGMVVSGTRDGSDVSGTVDPESKKKADELIEKVSAKYIEVCEQLGGDKVLACVKQLPDTSGPGCPELLGEFKKRAE
jgi:hypothetical protein